MDENELHRWDATGLAELIGSRQVSATEVAEAHLRRIEAVNPKINAMVTVLADQALAAAAAADAAVAAGQDLGPFHGVPFTVKDSLDVAGAVSARGSALFKDHVADVDATAVARLRAAGGIPLAKANLPRPWPASSAVPDVGRTHSSPAAATATTSTAAKPSSASPPA